MNVKLFHDPEKKMKNYFAKEIEILETEKQQYDEFPDYNKDVYYFLKNNFEYLKYQYYHFYKTLDFSKRCYNRIGEELFDEMVNQSEKGKKSLYYNVEQLYGRSDHKHCANNILVFMQFDPRCEEIKMHYMNNRCRTLVFSWDTPQEQLVTDTILKYDITSDCDSEYYSDYEQFIID
jgi:hypothetical protein